MTTTTMTHKVSVRAEQDTGLLGDGRATYDLDIWEDGNGKLLVRLMKNDKAFANKSFRDCETQHHDSERWLNDQVGYPNPFAGILSNTAWR
jgi:hypothetical protein